MRYRGKEKESCLPPQIQLLKCHMALEATRAIKIHHIPFSKTLVEVRHELGEALQRMMVTVQLFKPDMPHLYDIEGKTAIIEFSTLIDAIEAYDLFKKDDVYGFENNEVEFVPELTTKPQPDKTYCGCLCCKYAREEKEENDRKRIEKLRSDYSNATSAVNSNHTQGGGTNVPKSTLSDNQHHHINATLAAAFETTAVTKLDVDGNTTTYLTADNFKHHGLFVPQLPAANSGSDLFGTTYSNAGSPTDLTRTHPSIGGYNIRNAASRDSPSEKTSVYLSDDESVDSTGINRPTINTNLNLHADRLTNVVTDIDSVHDMHGDMTEYQTWNSD